MKARKVSKIDRSAFAIADRLQTVFDWLTSDTVGAQAITVDYGAFNRAITYYRRLGSGQIKQKRGPFMPDEEGEIMEVLNMPNQSLSWVFYGDASEMILRLAANTCSVREPELLVVK